MDEAEKSDLSIETHRVEPDEIKSYLESRVNEARSMSHDPDAKAVQDAQAELANFETVERVIARKMKYNLLTQMEGLHIIKTLYRPEIAEIQKERDNQQDDISA